MPSYQYTRDIKPEDLKLDTPPEYTQKQKAKNWWLYHKVWLALGVVAAVLAGVTIYDIVTRVTPDLTVGVLCPYTMPAELTEKLEQGLAAYVGDLNGDGKVAVQVDAYSVGTVQTASLPQGVEVAQAAGDETDPFIQMAGMVRLTGAFEDGNPVMFLLHPGLAQAYQAEYEILGWQNGDMAGADTPVEELGIRFADIDVLAGMDLIFPYGLEEIELDGHNILDDFLLGVRAVNDTRLEEQKGGPQRWQQAWDIIARLQAGTPAPTGTEDAKG